jgi:hypothetical protein
MIRLLCLVLVASLLASAVCAETLQAVCTATTTIGVAYSGKSPRVFIRVGEGRWRPAEVKLVEGRLTFELDPAKLGAANILLLIDPPAGLVLDDFEGPALVAVKIDGKPTASGSTVDLGNVTHLPGEVAVTFKDAANALAADGFQVQVDGDPLPRRQFRVTKISAKEAAVKLSMPQVDYGAHEIAIAAGDASPQANGTTLRLRFNYLEAGNVALAALGAQAAVDSCFPGYESLAALNDGVTTMPGDHCGNDLSWASAETSTDHWAEITLPRPTLIREVTVYWAAYTSVYHTPRQFEVQIPEGAGWKALYHSPAGGEKPALLTTARFDPVTTSKFRVYMPNGQGPVSRPDLLWIGEIKAR